MWGSPVVEQLYSSRERGMPGYPTGWFHVAYSAEILPGTVHRMRYFGRDLVAVRGASGALRIVEAHCPHRGTHLGSGAVAGDDLVCPMHGWCWGPDGANTRAPGSERLSARVLTSVPCLELSGLVLMWHQPDGGLPTWQPPAIDYDSDAGFFPMFPHGSSCAEVLYPPQLALENNVDPHHVQFVHRWPASPTMPDFRADGPRFESLFEGSLPTARGAMDVRIRNEAWGVGLLYSWFEGLLRTAQVVAHTPIDRERSHLRHSIWAQRQPGDVGDEPTGLAKAVIAAQFTEGQSPELGDKKIWEHQIYRRRAGFTREEGPAYAALRGWSRQFYDAGEWDPFEESLLATPGTAGRAGT